MDLTQKKKFNLKTRIIKKFKNKDKVMSKKIDLTKILKDCPKGFKLYSLLHGEVSFRGIDEISDYPITYDYPIMGCMGESTSAFYITRNGAYSSNYDGDCILFPSKEQRDWSKFTAPWYKKEKFDYKTLKPFDKVIARCSDFKWVCDMFSHYDKSKCVMPYVCVGGFYETCIPYNDETKHLVGTTAEAPEYYRYCEE